MRKYKKDGILYMETEYDIWATDVIKTLNLLPDLETICVTSFSSDGNGGHKGDVHSYKVKELLFNRNKPIRFSIETKKGIIELDGIFLGSEYLPMEQMRNEMDVLFIPIENAKKFLQAKSEYEQFKLCHFINISTMHNIEFINIK